MWRMFVLVLFSSLVLAADLDDAKDLYAKGEFLRASRVAATLETSEGFSFAARALAEYSNTRPKSERDEHYSQCEIYARKAVQQNPKNADGYFEIAVAVGQLANLRDVTYAISSGVPSQIRDNLNTALELNPRHWFAMVVLGRWHAEMTSRGIGWLYGANGGRALELLELAIRTAPKRILVRVEVALALLVLDKPKYRDRAKAEIQTAVKLEPTDFAERRQLERAKDLLEEWR
jgi:tetratricopeptide (TPR) repeat protein